ncbi:peptidoglycan bridge formation glycyltransferase FemA/FemB family protein [Treponema sp. TIM-1]|uniref:lipid II:glycine glycyltransferase FemX n=1 Tax=Treponema sp. TIM-1 TaxID=2898417 RepID=UPI00397F375C
MRYLRGIIPAELSCCGKAGSFLQSDFWGDFKARFGWTARAFLADWAGAEALSLLILWRPLAPALSFAYVPWGPELPPAFPTDDGARNGALKELAQALRSLLPGNTAFIRFDPPWYTEGAETAPPRIDPPFSRAGMDVQPPDTVIMGLAASEEELLGGMKPKWRYNIGLAAKKGVVVDRRDEQDLDVFYALYRETAKRDGIAIHGPEYYKTLFVCSREKSAQEFRLYLASHEGVPIAGSIVLFRGPEAVYLYGASSNQKRNLMAPYALQWRAMQDARAAGCMEYDLYGIPPREDPTHPMAGLYRFKTGFGGRIIHRSGSWDYTYRGARKSLFTVAESLRKFLRSIKKR